MEQEDYLKRQIDVLGQVLGRMLAKLPGSGSLGLSIENLEEVNQGLKNQLGLDFEKLESISPDQFVKNLQAGREWNENNLDKLSDLLMMLAADLRQKETEKNKIRHLADKSLAIQEYIDRTSLTYSFDRHRKMEEIKKML